MSASAAAVFHTENHGMNADERRPVGATELRKLVQELEQIDAEAKELNERKKDTMTRAKNIGIQMKPFRLMLKNRKRDRSEVAEEIRIAELYQEAIESGGNLRVVV